MDFNPAGCCAMTPEIDAIKASFLRCRKVVEVNDCSRHHMDAVHKLSRSEDRDERTMAIQIKNLAKYMRIIL